MLSWTFVLYTSIVILTTFFACQSQVRLPNGNVKFKVDWLAAAFLVHWVFIAFSKTGTDHEQYLWIITDDSKRLLAMGIEVGFNGLCILLYNITHNAEVVIFLIKTLALSITYQAFYLIRREANLGFAVGAYSVWQYFFSFYILAHSLAIALVFLAAVLILRNDKWYWPLILSIIASTVHSSALIIVVLCLAISLLNSTHLRIKTFGVLVLIIGVALILNYANVIFTLSVDGIESFAQYGRYESSTNTGVGYFNYIVFAYIFVVILLPLLNCGLPSTVTNASLLFYFFSFASYILGYLLGTSRLNQYALILFGAAIPWYFYHERTGKVRKSKYIDYPIQKYSWILYMLFVAIMSLMSFTNPHGSSDMYNYEFFNPFGA